MLFRCELLIDDISLPFFILVCLLFDSELVREYYVTLPWRSKVISRLYSTILLIYIILRDIINNDC